MQKKTKKTILISGVSLIITAAIISIIVAIWPKTAPNPRTEPEKAMAFVATRTFNQMPERQKLDYINALRENRQNISREKMAKLPEEQRKALMENMMSARMSEEKAFLAKFFKMSKAEQLAALDLRIEERDKRMKEMRANRENRSQINDKNNNSNTPANLPPRNNSNSNRPHRPTAQMQRDFYESSEPTVRAQMHQYRQLERLRRQGKI